MVAAGCGSGKSGDRTIEVDLTAIELGSYALDLDPTLSDAIAELGRPDECRIVPETKYAAATWHELGLTIFAGRCRQFREAATRAPRRGTSS
jgi:hypothetical protein